MADKNKKMNVFQRIAQLFKDVRTELKRVVWPSKEKLKNTCAVVLVVIVFFAIYLSIINNGGVLENELSLPDGTIEQRYWIALE